MKTRGKRKSSERRKRRGFDDLQASKEEWRRWDRNEGERRELSCESPGIRNGSRLPFIPQERIHTTIPSLNTKLLGLVVLDGDLLLVTWTGEG